MAHGNVTIPIPGELRAVDVNGRVVSADGVYDYNENKTQETINAEVSEAIGTGGSVDSRIAAAINALDSSKSQSAGADGLALNIVEENGKITSISGSIASNTYDAYGAASSEATRAQNAESALGGRVTTLETAVGSGGSVDSRIAAAKAEIKGNATSACDTLGEAEALISTEASRAQAAEQSITSTVTSRLDTQDAEIALLNGAEVIVVEDHTAVSSPDPQKIYREIGTSSYTDWMNQTGNANDWKAIATYTPGIDNEPTSGSNNLVKSGGVQSSIDTKLNKDVGINLVDPSQCSRGVINSDGSIDTSDWITNIYQISGYIPVNGKNIIGNLFCISPFSGGNVYDKNKQFIRTIGFTNQYMYQDGDYYVRLSFADINFDTRFPYANYGTTLLPYVPYTETNTIDGKFSELNNRVSTISDDVQDIKDEIKEIDFSQVCNGQINIQLAQSSNFVYYAGTSTYQITDNTLLIGSNRRDEWCSCQRITPNMGKYLYISFTIRNTQNHQSDFGLWCSPDYDFHDGSTFYFGEISLAANETRNIDLQIDLAHLVVYQGYTDGLSLWLQPKSYESMYAEVEITGFNLYQMDNQRTYENIGGKDLPSIFSSIDATITSIKPSAASENMYVAPNGDKYLLSINTQGQFFPIPLYPDSVAYIGNSLLHGSGYGMAASDKYHDYYHLVNEFLKTKKPSLEISQRINVGLFETATSVQDAYSKADAIVEQVPANANLVFVQCGDNVPVSNYEMIFLPGLLYLIQGIRTKAQAARVILIASWYGNVTSIMNTVSTERGTGFVNISNIADGYTINHIGAIQTFDDSTTRTVSNVTNVVEETNDEQEYNYKLSVTFTVASSSYTTILYCNSYSLDNNVLTYVSDQSVIQDAGIASHPNDLGFTKISNKILYDGGFVDTEEFY